MKRLALAAAPHEVDPIVRWRNKSTRESSEEINRFNNALFCLTGDDRLNLALDLFDVVVRGRADEIQAVFGDKFKCPLSVEYKVNNLGGVIQSLHVGQLFSVFQSSCVLGHRFNWRKHMDKISYYHSVILSRWRWEDHTRIDDNRQQDNIRFSMQLSTLVKK
ncbi:MAG: hypothetical protein EXS46_00205 [Candidatus Taylorbacteria bacterium]|nr:hypothetical protein [Candidatus Taylorbacteria bacterium]